MDYITIEHATCNENGREQVVFENSDFVRMIIQMIKKRTFNVPLIQKEYWEFRFGAWVNKQSGAVATGKKEMQISYYRKRL
jgi:hypothetical protein